jgi:precorrin-2 methylase
MRSPAPPATRRVGVSNVNFWWSNAASDLAPYVASGDLAPYVASGDLTLYQFASAR